MSEEEAMVIVEIPSGMADDTPWDEWVRYQNKLSEAVGLLRQPVTISSWERRGRRWVSTTP